jgi:hypothetical protein
MKHINSTEFIHGKQNIILSVAVMLLFIFGAVFLAARDKKTGEGTIQEQERTQDLIMIPCFSRYFI